jgi:hypothetical protein
LGSNWYTYAFLVFHPPAAVFKLRSELVPGEGDVLNGDLQLLDVLGQLNVLLFSK